MTDLAEQAVCFAAERVANQICDCVSDLNRPHVIFKPKLSIDGNQWCALYGDNLQDGVAGFGDSPALAMSNFDSEWFKKLELKNE